MLKGDDLMCAIAFNNHDSSVAFSFRNRVVLVLEAERIFREKKKCCNSVEMEYLIKLGLTTLGKEIKDITNWALCSLGNPWLNESHIKPLAECDYYWGKVSFLDKTRNCLIISHHYAHACSYYFSDYQDAVIQTCDGGGDFSERVAVFYANQLDIERQPINYNTYITSLSYSLISNYLYGEKFSEGKLMALAGLEPSRDVFNRLIEDLLPILNNYSTDVVRGASFDNMDKNLSIGCEIVTKNLDTKLKNYKLTSSDVSIETMTFASSFQKIFRKRRFEDIQSIFKNSDSSNIVLSGGACHNLTVNTDVWRNLSKNVFIPPFCDDSGQSLGALAKLITIIFQCKPVSNIPYLGLGSEIDINHEEIYNHAKLLAKNEIIFLHNGASEIGPRALGHRSILARPDNIVIKSLISETIKNREKYRPVAPIVLESEVLNYFDGPDRSPYMQHLYKANDLTNREAKSCIHSDGTARVQTVGKHDDKYLTILLEYFFDIEGIPILLNTSLNTNGMPIAQSIKDTKNILKSVAEISHGISIIYNGKNYMI